MSQWQTKGSRILLDRPWLRVREDRVLLPGADREHDFYVVEGSSWAAALAITDQGEAVLVEQYRHGVARMSRELPAGVVDPGELPADCARRELLEETGYAANAWQELSRVAAEPTRHTHHAHFFFATSARWQTPPTLEPTERIQVKLVPVPVLLDQVANGEIEHGVHVGAILLAHYRGWLNPWL